MDKKASTYNFIPTLLVGNSDIMSPYITEMYNKAKHNAVFALSLVSS